MRADAVKYGIVGTALALALYLPGDAAVAQAQAPSPQESVADPDPELSRAQLRMYAAEAAYYATLVKRMQAALVESGQREAAKDLFWAEWIGKPPQPPNSAGTK